MKKVIAFVLAGLVTACADQCASDVVDGTDVAEDSVACADTSTHDESPGEVGQQVQEEVEAGN